MGIRGMMMIARSLVFAGLLGFLAGCGGDRSSRDASTDSRTKRTEDAASAASPASTGSGVPAFANESAASGDSAADSAATISSVYTSLEESACRVVERDEETGDTSSRCPGAAGHALLVHDGDARMSVDVVAPGGRAHPLRYWGVITSAFSSLGPRAEWRMRNGAPIALIVRVNAFENPEVPDQATSYLAVAKLTARETCVTDRIPPSATANEAARQAADRSASKPCMRDLGDA
jgi:hypothetical protein